MNKVTEVGGISAEGKEGKEGVLLVESANSVTLAVPPRYSSVTLSSDGLRSLARQLNRFARRIDARGGK